MESSHGVVKKLTVPGAPTNVMAIGGLNSATVKWKTPTSNGGKAITSYKVTYFPGAKVHVCKASGLSCIIDIPNPNKPSPKPIPLSYYFTVTAVNSIGAGPASSKSAVVSVRFRATVDLSHTFRVPTVTPTPTPSISPSPVVSGITKFDGNYAGQAIVTISQTEPTANVISTTIPAAFTIVNGFGKGSTSDWTVQGQITDAAGAATVTAFNSLYGFITFAVSFIYDSNTSTMSGNGSGSRAFALVGIGSGTVTFLFSITSR
jgi:hypothetical protein